MIQDNQSNSGGFAAVLDALRQKYGWKLNVQIGEGGFAYVYKENVDGLPRAVKISKSSASKWEREKREKVAKELEVLKDLGGHARLLTLVKFEWVFDHLVTVWELAEGSLADVMEKCEKHRETQWQNSDLDQLMQWMKEAAEGIDYLNQNGVYHRDIKPQNLFLVRGCVKVGDFGLAKEATATTGRHTGGGTPGYMPPEAMAGRMHRTIDVYGLAASYVRLRTGREPFGTTDDERYRRPQSGDFERGSMSKAESQCMAWALYPDPEKHFSERAVAWVRKLDQLHHASQSKPSRPGQPEDGPKIPIDNNRDDGTTIRRNWQALLAVGALCGLMLVWWLIRTSDCIGMSPPMQSPESMQTAGPTHTVGSVQSMHSFPSTGVIYIVNASRDDAKRESLTRLENALERFDLSYDSDVVILLAPVEHRLTKPITIRRSLTLIGPGPDQCRVTCDGQGFMVSFSRLSGHSYINGVRFQHFGTAWADVLQVDSAKLTLENCVLTGAVLKQEAGQYFGGIGLRAYGNAEVKATNCRFFDNGLHGVEVAGSATVTLENNTFENNGQDGIAFFNNGSGLVRGNVVRSNGWDGIGVGHSAWPTLIENRCEGNKRYGIGFFETATGIARDNICTGNVQGQIYVAPTAAPDLVGNSGEITKGTR